MTPSSHLSAAETLSSMTSTMPKGSRGEATTASKSLSCGAGDQASFVDGSEMAKKYSTLHDSSMLEGKHSSNKAVSNSQTFFPLKLHQIISDESNSESISWLQSGKAFIIVDKKRFAEEILPRFFSQHCKFTSFTRKLARWRFNRVPRGPLIGAYYHELFVRDNQNLCYQMECKNESSKNGNTLVSAIRSRSSRAPLQQTSNSAFAQQRQQYHHSNKSAPVLSAMLGDRMPTTTYGSSLPPLVIASPNTSTTGTAENADVLSPLLMLPSPAPALETLNTTNGILPNHPELLLARSNNHIKDHIALFPQQLQTMLMRQSNTSFADFMNVGGGPAAGPVPPVPVVLPQQQHQEPTTSTSTINNTNSKRDYYREELNQIRLQFLSLPCSFPVADRLKVGSELLMIEDKIQKLEQKQRENEAALLHAYRLAVNEQSSRRSAPSSPMSGAKNRHSL